MWPNRRILDLLGLELPILQAPMAGPVDSEMVIAVSEAGALGGLPCALMTPDKARAELGIIRQRTARPINVNFFCHKQPEEDAAREAAWKRCLEPHYVELGLDPGMPVPRSARAPFDDEFCAIVEEFRPEVVSFHFGLPDEVLLDRAKATGAKVLSSATTADEAVWLEARGCDAIIAQGSEAGGHRGIFLTDDVANQPGTFALVPQVVDAVTVPVIAAGGIADARGIVAAFALGASAVQIGTAYLFCPEAKVSARAQGRIARRQGRPHRCHQRLHRPSGAGHRQPHHARGRPDLRSRARISACWWRVGAFAGKGRAAGFGRLHFALVGAGRSARPGDAGRRTDPDAWRGSASAASPSLPAEAALQGAISASASGAPPRASPSASPRAVAVPSAA